MTPDNFINLQDGFYVDKDYAESFRELGLTSIEAVFNFQGDENLHKANIAKHRSRLKFELGDLNKTLFLKRYDNPPKFTQLKNWLTRQSKASTADYDRLPPQELKASGIDAPKTVAYGSEWGGFFEKRSFMVMENIENGVSLEEKLPECFYDLAIDSSHKMRCEFINKLADFTRKFHDTGYRHRDYYLCHIFLVNEKDFCLTDMHRSFKPGFLSERYRLKDITQLHYSSPGDIISQADRLRFYLRYSGKDRPDDCDRKFLRKVKAKAWRVALHDIKHKRVVPFTK
jgi:hypothetical protein